MAHSLKFANALNCRSSVLGSARPKQGLVSPADVSWRRRSTAHATAEMLKHRQLELVKDASLQKSSTMGTRSAKGLQGYDLFYIRKAVRA